MNLREYQQKAVEWAKTDDGLIIAPAGSGKTWIAASIIQYFHKHQSIGRFGWLAPTRETCQQARISLRVAGVPDEIVDIRCPHESVDFSKKDMLIVDECFPAWIKIDDKPISEIKAGDMVDSYNHDSKTIEKRRVLDVFKTPAPDMMVTVWTEKGPTTCTPGHPFWNGFEYVPAASLTSNDVVSTIPTHEHGMQGVRLDDRKKRSFLNNSEAGLRTMQNRSSIREKEARRNSVCLVQDASHMYGKNSGSQEFGCFEEGTSLLLDSMPGLDGFENEFGNNVCHKQKDGRQDFEMDERKSRIRSNQKARLGIAEKDRPQAQDSWWEWNGLHVCSTPAFVHVQPSNGVCDTDSREWNGQGSKLLQGGLGGTIGEAGGGSGRPISQLNQQKSCGQKENRNTQFVRVVRVEIHKQGSPSWDSAMRGQNHVYNFSVEGNENYFANGILVHNCKHSPAAGWRRIIESCNGPRYGFDATPWCDDEERNAVTRTLFFNRTYEIKRSDIGDSLADAYLEISDATDLSIQQKIDDNIDRLFNARRRYMRISDDELKRMCAWESLVDIGICQNRERNRYAMNYALEHLDMQTLILIPRITLGEEYESWIPNSRLVHSKIGKKDRRAYMEEFKAGNLRTMIATSLADEGLDLPNVELLIMVSGGRSSQKTIQRASRALRKTETKNCATIVDFSDKFHPIGAFHAKKRMKCYRELGCVFIQ